MFYVAVASWIVVFLAVALIAGVLGSTAIASAALSTAWTLFVVGLILFVVFADGAVGKDQRVNGRD
jgi:uncharacterized membrane protein YtjA (UPF0391 family)